VIVNPTLLVRVSLWCFQAPPLIRAGVLRGSPERWWRKDANPQGPLEDTQGARMVGLVRFVHAVHYPSDSGWRGRECQVSPGEG
jgi:hypothetical protein